MKNKSTQINDVLKTINSLDIDNQCYISKILSKRLIELRRAEIAESAQQAEQAYIEGNVKKGSSIDLLRDLNDWDILG